MSDDYVVEEMQKDQPATVRDVEKIQELLIVLQGQFARVIKINTELIKVLLNSVKEVNK